jgi:hypothetical protein
MNLIALERRSITRKMDSGAWLPTPAMWWCVGLKRRCQLRARGSLTGLAWHVAYWHFSDLTHPVGDVCCLGKSRSSRRAVKVTRLTPSGSRWVQFGRPLLAGIAAIRWIGCLAGHYLGARRRNRFRLAKYRYPLTRGRLGRSNRLVASRVCATLEMLPNISRAG